MGLLYEYVAAFFWHWWPLVTAGSLLGISEYVERYWQWGSTQLKRIPVDKRRQAKAGALLIACLYAGFLAWGDEHAALFSANEKLNQATNDLAAARRQSSQSGAKMNFIQLAPVDNPIDIDGVRQDSYHFEVWFRNLGQQAAQSSSLRALPYLSDAIFSRAEEETQFANALRNRAGDVSKNDVQPGDTVFFSSNEGFTGTGWDLFTGNKKILYLFGQLTYQDESSPDRPTTTDICIFFVKNDLTTWNYCTSGHNRITRGN